MKIKKLVLGTLLATAIMGIGLTANTEDVQAKSKVVTIKATKKSQVAKAKKKALKYYNKTKPYCVTGKYSGKVTVYIKKQVMKQNNIKWCPTPTTSSKKSLKKYKEGVKYLGLIVSDINEEFNNVWTTYNVYFTQYTHNTESEVLSAVTDKYLNKHMIYLRGEPDICPVTDYKKIYKGTYKRDCGGYTRASVNIIQAMGYKARKERTSPTHIRPQMQVQDVDGNNYWRITSPQDEEVLHPVYIPSSIEDMYFSIENDVWE